VLYLADFRNSRIQKFDAKGLYVTSWGDVGDQPGQFKDPCGVAVGGGRVYVADTFNNRVQVFDDKGTFLLHFVGGFSTPRGIAVDREGRIWVADSGNCQVKLFSGDGNPIKTIGKNGSGRGEFVSPIGITADQKGLIYVADAGNTRVQILDREGNCLSEFKVDGWEQGVFNEPYLDVDARGDVYLTDPRGNRAMRYSRTGELLGVLKPLEGGGPLLRCPMGIAVEWTGSTVYIVDSQNHRIREFTKNQFK
jgi:DNA-binding beta-propeller fold protein YncE